MIGDLMGSFYRPLYFLKPDVSRGPPGLSGARPPQFYHCRVVSDR